MKTLQKPKLPHSPGLVLTTIVLMTVALVQIFPFYRSDADVFLEEQRRYLWRKYRGSTHNAAF